MHKKRINIHHTIVKILLLEAVKVNVFSLPTPYKMLLLGEIMNYIINGDYYGNIIRKSS